MNGLSWLKLKFNQVSKLRLPVWIETLRSFYCIAFCLGVKLGTFHMVRHPGNILSLILHMYIVLVFFHQSVVCCIVRIGGRIYGFIDLDFLRNFECKPICTCRYCTRVSAYHKNFSSQLAQYLLWLYYKLDSILFLYYPFYINEILLEVLNLALKVESKALVGFGNPNFELPLNSSVRIPRFSYASFFHGIPFWIY